MTSRPWLIGLAMGVSLLSNPTMRAQGCDARGLGASGSCRPQDTCDRSHELLPFRRFDGELFPSFRGQSVVLRPSIVL